MNIYHKKQIWKWILFALAVVIVSISLWYTNQLVKKIAHDEKDKVELWAEAIQRRASIVKYTENLFEKLKLEERKRVQLWAEATKKLINADINEDLTFYSDIISGNTNIPVILTDEKDNIISAKNVDFSTDTVKKLDGQIKEDFTVYEPIVVHIFHNKKSFLYYKESLLFNELRNFLNDIVTSFISEVVNNSASVPVIITDSSRQNIIAYGNMDSTLIKDKNNTKDIIESMTSGNQYFEIELANYGKSLVFYKDSYILTQLRYFPFFQFAAIGLFLLIAYLLFSMARNAEQNQVWAGMAKETAHQIGTPLSSLMAWVEILKEKNEDMSIIYEIEKDIKRLTDISYRFSKIGSKPSLDEANLCNVIEDYVDYMKQRTSKKIKYVTNMNVDNIILPLNITLFEWVIENLLKNAAEAISGEGEIIIDISENDKNAIIDVTDSGKGIPKREFKTIFNPGYTSKKRGWGLGLSLSERIIKKYHNGRIFVKQSSLNKGTTFRIMLPK